MNDLLTTTALSDCDGALLLRTVDDMGAYVVDRMRGRPDEVDGVLQRVREIVWRRRGTFDPAKGRPADFVFGVTRNVITKELCRRRPLSVEFNDQVEAPTSPDPLSILVSRFDSHRWMRLVADAAGENDWEIVVSLALGGDEESAMLTSGLSARTIRATRERVSLIAATVRAALNAADHGRPATLAVARDCIPDTGGFHALLPHMDLDCNTLAKQLRIHPGTVRARTATLKKLLGVAIVTLQSETA